MADRESIRQQMQKDGIEFILAQFVDMHGSAKVKMVPASCFDDVIDDGAGFAGAAVWGVGQGPHSHDMMARIDLDSYTPLAWMPNTARFAADLFVDEQSYPFCPRTNLKRVLADVRAKGYVFNVGMEPEHFLVTRREDGSIAPWDPDHVDSLAKPCYDFRSMAPAMSYLQELTASLNKLGWGVYQTDHEDANGQFEVNFAYQDALTTADRIYVLQDGDVADRQEVRGDRHAHAEAVQRSDGQRTAYPFSSGGRRERPRSVRGLVGCPRLRLLGVRLPFCGRGFASCSGFVRGDQSHGQLLQAIAVGLGAHTPAAAATPGRPPSSLTVTTTVRR